MKPIRLETTSVDGTKINLEALYQIAPSCFTEKKDEETGEIKRVVNFETLRQLLGGDAVDEDEEMYQFTWPGKRAARYEAAEPIDDTLRPVPADSVDWDTTENLYIEGDNLRVLKLLQRGYMGKVKMIYIDPPYNTGNDFVYHDDFAHSAEEEDLAAGNIDEEGNRYRRNLDSNGRFHSDWCSMMYSRLLVAHSLLKEDGVIFISIDDNEVHNLRKICDEVFGAENLVSTIHCQLSTTQGMKVKAAQMGNIVKNAEYILCYSNNGDKTIGKQLLYDLRDKYDEHYSLYLRKDGSVGQLKELYDYRFPKDCSNKRPYKLAQAYAKSEEFADIVRSHLADIVRSDKVTGFNDDTIKNGFWTEVTRNDKTYLLTRDNNGKIRQLLRLSDSWGATDGFNGEQGLRKIRGDWWEGFYIDMGNVSKEGDVDFKNGKKPLRLIKQLIKFVTPYSDPDSLILDFFSGSATTAHAVMQLNAEDGGKRKYICVQLPEETPEGSEARKAGYNTIPEIAKERIRRSAKQILSELDIQLKKAYQVLYDSCGGAIESPNPSGLTYFINNATLEQRNKFDKAQQSYNVLKEKKEKLDMGFRVFHIDSGNYKDVTMQPNEYDQQMLDLFVDNIKADRTDLDLLFGAMLAWGVQLSLPMTTEEVDGCKIYAVDGNGLVACFAENVSENVVQAMAAKQPLRVLFRDSCFDEDKTKINIFERFKQQLDWDEKEAIQNIRVV